MAEFKKGDKVFVKPGEVSRYGWAPEPEPEWKPGTLVAATMDDGAEVVGFPTVDGYIAFVDGDGDETREARADARSIRPLVVLDPESDTDRLAAIIRLLRRLGHDGNHNKGAAAFAEAILEHLERRAREGKSNG